MSPSCQRHQEPYDSVLDLIGWMPIVRLWSVTDGAQTPLHDKCEFRTITRYDVIRALTV